MVVVQVRIEWKDKVKQRKKEQKTKTLSQALDDK